MISKYSRVKLKKNENIDQFEYFLIEDLSAIEKIGRLILQILYFPVRVIQFLLGRLLSYCILNPLFRKQELDVLVLDKDKKHPDPAFSEQEEATIIDILPHLNFISQSVKNWWYAGSIDLGLTKDALRLNQVLAQVEQVIKQGTPCEKVHFKGLNYLNDSDRELLWKRLEQQHHYNFKHNQDKYHFFSLKTTHAANLDSVEIRGPSVAYQEMASRKFIIYCLPRTLNYVDLLKQHAYFANQLNTTVVAFNYRGTGRSRGLISNQYDMRQDALAQVQRLLALGAKPENIALMGECLGGNIATHVAATLHQQQCPVKLFNARSFRSSSSLLMGFILPDKNMQWTNPMHYARMACAGLVYPIFTSLLYIAGWDLDIEKAFKSIPTQDKEYLVVRSKKDATGRHYRDDALISHNYASIYSLIRAEQKQLKKKQASGETLTAEERLKLNTPRHMRKFHVDETLRADAKTNNGHVCQLRYLTSTKSHRPVDAREFTLSFFRQAWSCDSTMNHAATSSCAI